MLQVSKIICHSFEFIAKSRPSFFVQSNFKGDLHELVSKTLGEFDGVQHDC